MSARRRRCLVLAVFLLLVSCRHSESLYELNDELHMLAQAGILSQINTEGPGELNYTLYEVRSGDMERSVILYASVVFPIWRHLYMDRAGGVFSGVYASSGQRVEEGQLLAEMSFDTQSREIDRLHLAGQIEMFEARYDEEINKRLMDIAEAEASLAMEYTEEGINRRVHGLNTLTLQYRRFLYSSERIREGLKNRLFELDDIIAGSKLYAPFDGFISYASPINSGTQIDDMPLIITLIDESVMRFSINAPLDIVRYGDMFTLDAMEYPISFDVCVVSDPLASGRRDVNTMFILEPADRLGLYEALSALNIGISELANMRFVANLAVPLAYNSLIVHRRAVIAENNRDYVFVYENGNIMKRYISTGARNGEDVQVLSGLFHGQMVILH